MPVLMRKYGYFGAMWIAILLAVASAGCAGSNPAESPANDSPTPDVFAQASYMIVDGSGLAREAGGIDKLNEVTPFEIILPRPMPEGVILDGIRVSMPPDSVDDSVKHLHVNVSMIYRNESMDGSFTFHLEERIDGPAELEHPDLRNVSIDISNGDQVELAFYDEENLTRAAWRGCGVGFSLMYGPEYDGFSSGLLPNLVKETVESCG